MSKELLGAGLALTGVLAAGYGGESSQPDAKMSISCERGSPGSPDSLSLNALSAKTHKEIVTIDTTDGQEKKTITVRLIGRVSVNGNEMNADDAGRVLEKLPTAKLIAGAPIPNPQYPDHFYAPQEGFTLVCNGDEPEVGPPPTS